MKGTYRKAELVFGLTESVWPSARFSVPGGNGGRCTEVIVGPDLPSGRLPTPPLLAICLAWLLARPVVTSVIIGAKRMDQLHENLAAGEFGLSAEEMKQLDEVSAIPEEHLDWVVSFASQNQL